MEATIVTAVSVVLGSCVGGAASITGTWIAQRNQTARELIEVRLRDRETLYGEFITEASRLAVNAVGNSLDSFEELVTLYGILGRIRLSAGDKVLVAAVACCRRIVDLYAKPNMTKEQIREALDADQFDPLKEFSVVCREELTEIAAGIIVR